MKLPRTAYIAGLRILGALLLLPGVYCVHMFRTSGAGYEGLELLALPVLAAYYTLIPSLLLCADSRLRGRYVLRVLALNVLIFCASDLVARIEERAFVLSCQRGALAEGADQFHTSRWWPFEHHALFYHPESRSLVGTD